MAINIAGAPVGDNHAASVLPPELASINEKEPREALNLILAKALELKASDIFLICNGTHYVVSVRQLGVIRQLVVLSHGNGIQVLHLIKSAAGMDLAERRHPLDGRWNYQIDDNSVDFRVNSMGTLHGEEMVLRVLPASARNLDLSCLGFVGDQLNNLRAMLDRGSGLLLVTGPTGAGKSTTLYACLDYLNNGKRMISTLEDPIEHIVKGVRQCQVHSKIGLGFFELLRGILRQSPDVIMIGEIRDEETAQTAVRAANSGHLVLSSLHSPLAAGAVQSMLAYNVNPFFLANCLLGIVAQRLIRQISPTTRKMYDISHSPETFRDVQNYLEPGQGNVIYGPDLSDPESQDGYISRSGLFEVLTVNRAMKERVCGAGSAAEIHQAAVEGGMLDFGRAALLKVAQGETDVEEMSRVVPTLELADYD